jgi:hypothetical protein
MGTELRNDERVPVLPKDHVEKRAEAEMKKWLSSPLKTRGDHGVITLATTGEPLVPEIVSMATESGDHGVAMSDQTGGDHGVSITSLTTSYGDPELLSAFEALWTSPPIAIPFRPLKLRRLFQRPAKRPGKHAEAHYLAAWYQSEQPDLAVAARGIIEGRKRARASRCKPLRERCLDSRL